MRRLWISISVLGLLFFSAYLNTNYLHRLTDTLALSLEQAEEDISLGNRNGAIQKTERAIRLWEDRASYLHIILNHSEIDQVSLSFLEVQRLLTTQEHGGEYYAANAQLIARIRLLHEMEEFSLKNLL